MRLKGTAQYPRYSDYKAYKTNITSERQMIRKLRSKTVHFKRLKFILMILFTHSISKTFYFSTIFPETLLYFYPCRHLTVPPGSGG